jgi:dTDP-4-dehydrorhamnose 3,5-epimerase
MKFIPTSLEGCFEIEMTASQDERGWFGRFFCKKEFSTIGHTKEWVQMNHSFTVTKGALRGLHFQKPPFSEIKLVRCISGSVFDVVVDIRKNSKTFLRSFSIELSSEKRNMIYIPEGFAHGFQTLRENSELIYLHSQYYTPESESGIRYNDPMINIAWPLPVDQLSERDKNHELINADYKGIDLLIG